MRKRFFSLLSLLIAIPASSSITGVVINSDGQPVAGVKVSIYAPETIEAHRLRLVSQTPARTALATQTTDSKGAFNFESPKGQKVVDLTIEANGFAPDGNRLFADDEAGAIALIAAPTQRGTITAEGKPVAGATVVWIGANSDVLTKTDVDGHYTVPDPSKWANRLIIIHPDYAIVDEARIFRTSPRLDHILDRGETVKGRVVGEDVQTAVAKAPVLIDDFPLAVTADDGTFTIEHAPKNWQELQTRSSNLAAVRARTNSATVNVRLAKSGRITGSVRDAKTQLPLASAEVRLGPENPFAGRRGFNAGAASTAIESVLTDAKGNFSIAATAGRYQLSGVYPGSAIANVPVSLTAGQSVNKPLYATAHARVSGVVIDEDRRAVAGARLAAVPAGRAGGPMMFGPARLQLDMPGFSGPDGRFVLRDVSTETEMQVDAAKKGFPTAHSASLKLTPAERKSGVTITIPRGVAFTGRVTDANGRPLSGVAVEAVESQGGRGFGPMRRVVNMMMRNRDDDLVRSGTDGSFTVRVKEGTYDVVFKREGFATKTLRGQSISAASKPVDVKLDPGVEISGRVVRSGVGVEGVSVNAISESDSASAVTASDGSFSMTDLTPGQMMLSVVKQDAFIQQIRPITVPARDVVIELPPGGRIAGRVLDKSSHNPVTSFQAGISFTRSAGGMAIALPPMLKSFTSDDGSFTLENVPPGPTQLVVSAPGYTTARIPGLNVEDGKALNNVEVGLDSGVRLTGRVTATDGSPISGVQVREGGGSMGPAQMVSGAQATTDPNGEYAIEAVEPGQKTFTFAHQGYLRTDKTLNLSGREARLDVQLSSGVTLNGVVVTDAGAPVADASVNVMSAGPGQGARTDANGNFQMVGLAPGHYTIHASKQGLTDGVLQDFDVSAGAPARIVMKSGGTIAGHVTGLTNAELQNTIVTASGPNGGASGEVDSTGAYRIDGAPLGMVRVVARTNRGFGGGGKTSGVVSVQVDPGSTAIADIQFKSSTVVQGRVTRNGQPMANVMVLFNPRSGQTTSSSGTTDSSGSYEITGLDDGTYNVGVVDIDRSNAFSSTYDVHGSATFDIDIKTASLRGRVIDATTGEPLSGAQVQLSTSQGGAMGSRAALTDPAGSFFIDNVARGSYHAVAQRDGYGHAMRDIVIGDSAPDDLEFKLAPSDGVTLSVVDARDNRPLAANVMRIVDGAGQVVQAGATFRFNASSDPMKLTLAPGSYTITLTAMGYANKVINVTSPSQITVAMTPGGSLVLRPKSSSAQRARLVDSRGAIYRAFNVDPSPLTTTVDNIAGGTYTLQVLDSSGSVINTIPLTVVDGQQTALDI